jgi:outer membrane receptor protein involved in Fe transport
MNPAEVAGKVASVALVAALAVCAPLSATRAGTTGKLSGIVLDAKKQPLMGVNVILVGVPLGALSGADGRYVILNIPAGTYTVKASLIGYASTSIQNLAIPADRTTTQDVTLAESAIELKEVVVSAKKPIVELGLTSNIATISRQEIATLPVQELQDLVQLQAGVVQSSDGAHFRGGRAGEVQYQVDGISVNNPFNNQSSVKLDRSVLEEVQVVSGTFDAEYGQAMSGVVNSVLRRGSDKFTWSGEAYGGDYYYSSSNRPVEYDFHPGSLQNYQLTLSGPTLLPRTVYLLSGRYGLTNSPYWGQKQLVLFDQSVPNDTPEVAAPQTEPVGYNQEWQGLGKLSFRLRPGMDLSYSAVLNWLETRHDGSNEWNFRYDLNGLPIQRTYSAVHGFEWTQTLDPKTFYRFSVRQNYFDYQDMVYDDANDPRYDENGPKSPTNPNILNGATLYGVTENRFVQNTNALVFAGSISRQFRSHAVKGGFDWEPTHLLFGHPGWLQWDGVAHRYLRYFNAPQLGFPAPSEYRPVIGSAYLQDELEWNDILLRVGLRFEYFNPKAGVPSDPKNPANDIPGAPDAPLVAATRKLTFAPRIGVSYPVSPKSSLFFAYGHFYQMPQLGQMFDNANYSLAGQIQASSGKDYGTFGNPDVKPERTFQYQMGYKRQIGDWYGLDLTLFYKDVRDLLGSEVVTTYTDAQYKRLNNSDFGNVIGSTLALDQRGPGIVSTSLDYTWQLAKGNSSDPYETAGRVDSGEDPRPRSQYFDWDQRHTLNITVTAFRPGSFNVSGVFRAQSGQPYTPENQPYFREANSGRKPPSFLMDLRSEKSLSRLSPALTAFATVNNLFDSRFFNGAVFNNSGSPYYSATPNVQSAALADPTRYFGPRRIVIGFRWEPRPS